MWALKKTVLWNHKQPNVIRIQQEQYYKGYCLKSDRAGNFAAMKNTKWAFKIRVWTTWGNKRWSPTSSNGHSNMEMKNEYCGRENKACLNYILRDINTDPSVFHNFPILISHNSGLRIIGRFSYITQYFHIRVFNNDKVAAKFPIKIRCFSQQSKG